eukprot:COSAG02_NODE_66536_length_255_cov_0.660256_1_plen_52_part_10
MRRLMIARAVGYYSTVMGPGITAFPGSPSRRRARRMHLAHVHTYKLTSAPTE